MEKLLNKHESTKTSDTGAADLGTCHTLSQRGGTATRHHRLLTSHQVNHCTTAMKFKSIALSQCYRYSSTIATDRCCPQEAQPFLS